MVKAYVGIADSLGLQAFMRDDGRLLALIPPSTRSAPNQQRACFWVAVRDDVAEEVQQELVAGYRRQALLTLDALATDIAPLGW